MRRTQRLDLRHLPNFLAVVEEQHSGRAAVGLGIAQAPLSQKTELLEAALDVTLFDRTRVESRSPRPDAHLLRAHPRFSKLPRPLRDDVSEAGASVRVAD